MEITTENANTLFSDMFWKFKTCGVKAESRNGPVIRIDEPVLTTVLKPMERVLFHSGRDANPIFHLMEAIWMLAGRRDVAFPQMFNSRIGQYSDDGENFNAAYGYRWRHHFGFDQLKALVAKLKSDPGTRQAVVQMWDAEDLRKQTLDKACNMQLIFEINNGRLNMTVINRSNDAWYGYCGANIVHFTILQEFVAGAVGVELGEYSTFSTNLHLYTELYDAANYVDIPPHPEDYDRYGGWIAPRSLGVTPDNWETWLTDAEAFCTHPFALPAYSTPYLAEVVYPMAMVSYARKGKTGDGMNYAMSIEAQDWRLAAEQWVQRRETAKKP